ncbi:hypothetical protein OF83DRAFT_1287823 [Amylostereum chailletii]|nr:hypothetical protein OF83DRAFT_1287823 [Amylostereum chailletii]
MLRASSLGLTQTLRRKNALCSIPPVHLLIFHSLHPARHVASSACAHGTPARHAQAISSQESAPKPPPTTSVDAEPSLSPRRRRRGRRRTPPPPPMPDVAQPIKPLSGHAVVKIQTLARKGLSSVILGCLGQESKPELKSKVDARDAKKPLTRNASGPDTLDVAALVARLNANGHQDRPEYRSPVLRAILLTIIGSTPDVEPAWNAYRALTLLPDPDPLSPPTHQNIKRMIPYPYLHRLIRLLAAVHPRTRKVFLRLLSVLSTVHQTGGKVHLWEWNILIDAAGKGWRRTRPEDFRTALDAYSDMLVGRPPGSTFLGLENENVDGEYYEEDVGQEPATKPDIVTFTTLLALAVRTRRTDLTRHASALLDHSAIPPNVVSHMSMFGYFSLTNDILGVRETLYKMRRQGIALNNAAFNAILWAFAHNHRLDVAGAMYRVARHHLVPEEEPAEVEEIADRLAAEEDIPIPADLVPDEIAYNIMVQAYAYHGDLRRCLQSFTDMLVARASNPVASDKAPYTAWRSIFIGFKRHGTTVDIVPLSARLNIRDGSPAQPWTLEPLEQLFAQFLVGPGVERPRSDLLFWIVVAFWRTSGRDAVRVQAVIEQLHERFGGEWGGRLKRMSSMIYEIAKSSSANITVD